jgi:hypothetical protein
MYDLITKELPEVLKEANLGLVRDVTWRGVGLDMSSFPHPDPGAYHNWNARSGG